EQVGHGAPVPFDRHLGAEAVVDERPEELDAQGHRCHGGVVELELERAKRERFDIATELSLVAPPCSVGVAVVLPRRDALERARVLEKYAHLPSKAVCCFAAFAANPA